MTTQRAITVAPALLTFREQLDDWRAGQAKAIAQRIEEKLVDHIAGVTDRILAEIVNT